MILLPKELVEQLPALYAQGDEEDPMVYVKFLIFQIGEAISTADRRSPATLPKAHDGAITEECIYTLHSLRATSEKPATR